MGQIVILLYISSAILYEWHPIQFDRVRYFPEYCILSNNAQQ